MKLEEYKNEYRWHTGKASDVVRQLSFAGIAVVWIFRTQSQSGSKIPAELILPLGCLCISLTFDFLQYFFGYVIWYGFYQYHEKKNTKPSDDLTHSLIWPSILHICFLGKVAALLVSYFMLLKHVWKIWLI
jgi:hypothetical protein